MGPTIGIMLVMPMITLISRPYGNFKIVREIKQRAPKINASVSCPEINFEKVSFVRFATRRVGCTYFSGI